MRILVVGQVIGYKLDGSSAHTHGTEGFDLGVSRALADRGHDVFIVTSGEPGFLPRGDRGCFQAVTWEQAAMLTLDGVFISGIEGHYRLRGKWGDGPDDAPDKWRELTFTRVKKLGNVVIENDWVRPDSAELSYAKAVGLLVGTAHPQAASDLPWP